MISSFGPGLWLADGGYVDVAGFKYPTRMCLIELGDGSLAVWSPVALTDALAKQVSELGKVRALIAPNHLHHLALSEWVTAFPEAELFGAPGLAAKRQDLSFDAVLGDIAPELWSNVMDQTLIPGNLITKEIVFFHHASQAVIFCDFLQQFPKGHFSGWRRLVAQADGMIGETPQVPRKFRLATTGRAAARAAISKVLEWPSQSLVVAHGAPMKQSAQAHLKAAFAWL